MTYERTLTSFNQIEDDWFVVSIPEKEVKETIVIFCKWSGHTFNVILHEGTKLPVMVKTKSVYVTVKSGNEDFKTSKR